MTVKLGTTIAQGAKSGVAAVADATRAARRAAANAKANRPARAGYEPGQRVPGTRRSEDIRFPETMTKWVDRSHYASAMRQEAPSAGTQVRWARQAWKHDRRVRADEK